MYTVEICSDRNETKCVRYLRYVFHILWQLPDSSVIAVPNDTYTERNNRHTGWTPSMRDQTKFTDTYNFIVN